MHRIPNHESNCRRFHGHRYAAEITCSADSLDDRGRVIDFGVVKGDVGAWINDNWDHNAILMRGDPDPAATAVANSNATLGRGVYWIDSPPTAEAIARELGKVAAELLEPKGVEVVRVKVWETPNCSAEWTPPPQLQSSPPPQPQPSSHPVRGTPFRAVVLLSGGLDSAVCLALAIRDGYEVTALSFEYGQRHAVELDAASMVASHYGVRHEIVTLPTIAGSALTGDAPVPTDRSLSEISVGIPSTYVPARNLVFLSHAVAVAEAIGAISVFVGVNALDHTGYPDCRPDFIKAFEVAARLATRTGVNGGRLMVRTPLIKRSKADIVRLARRLHVPIEITHSCYSPTGALSCGSCDACIIRRNGFLEAGLPDSARQDG